MNRCLEWIRFWNKSLFTSYIQFHAGLGKSSTTSVKALPDDIQTEVNKQEMTYWLLDLHTGTYAEPGSVVSVCLFLWS